MIEPFKRVVRRHWPRLRLRTILLLTFTFVAALPGFGALFLRVYENALVRQSEAALIAEGTALSASAARAWSTHSPIAVPRIGAPSVDLRLTPILPRPSPRMTPYAPEPASLRWYRALAPTLRLTAAATGSDILLLDRNGVRLDRSRAGESWGDAPEVRAARIGRPRLVLRRDPGEASLGGFEWLSRAAGLRLHLAMPVIADGRVVGVLLLSHPPRALFAGLYADRGKIALGIALIFGTLVVLSGLLSRGIVRPVEALGAATRAVASGGGTVPETPTTAAIEIQALYRDFGSMAAAIERRSRYLRDFAHAVSHEFKTPLAGIRGGVELLQDHPDMAAADRDRFLANIAADGARLTQLVSRLLDLARADMESGAEGAATDVRDTAQRIADAQAGLAITLDLPPTVSPVAVPQGAIQAVLASLVENSRQAGATQVRITGETDADGVVLTIRDDGPGIPAGDRGRIFEPFFTSRRTEGGTGLGLPIARSLLEAQGGRITLSPDTGEGGATFRISLPVAHHD